MEQHHFDIINHATPRLESMDKALGRGKYTDDLELPNMAYAALVRCPYSHAKVLSIDVSEAEKVPGFLGCALPEEDPQAYFNCSGNPPSPLLMADEKVLTTEPLTIGDRVAVVAAETEEAARAAAEAVKVEYENLMPILDVKAALAENAPAMQPHLSDTNVVQRREVSQGDIAVGEEKSDIILEDHFVTPPMQHTMIELTCCICDFSDGEHMTIYSCSQTVFQERRILAELFGLKEVDVHIIKPLVGAGFGARQQLHAQHAAALISRKIKRPVKLLYSREEDFYSVVRHASDVDLRIGADKNGKLQLFDTTFRLNAGPYTTHTPTVVAAAARKLQYNVPNYSFIGLSVFTNHVTGGAFRGYGNTQLTFGREILMDRLAQKLDMDPIEFRLMNHVQVGECFPCASTPVSSNGIEDCARRCQQIQKEIDEKEPLIDDENIRQAWGISFSWRGRHAQCRRVRASSRRLCRYRSGQRDDGEPDCGGMPRHPALQRADHCGGYEPDALQHRYVRLEPDVYLRQRRQARLRRSEKEDGRTAQGHLRRLHGQGKGPPLLYQRRRGARAEL